MAGLAPGSRTIAEFRQLNGRALKAAGKDCVTRCQALDLRGGAVVAVDGAFFTASASAASVVTQTRRETDLKQIEWDIDAYCQGLEAQDEPESGSALDLGTTGALDAKLAQLKAQQARQQAPIQRLEDRGETPLSRTDPDARALRQGGQQRVGYHVESTVDAKHKLIVHHEVTHDGNDAEQRARQVMAATEVLGVDRLIAVADAGFYREAQWAAGAQADSTAYVAIPDKHRAVNAADRFCGAPFPSLPPVDASLCPGGQLLRPQGKPVLKRGVERTRDTGPASQCQGCPQAACLPERTPRRQIWRSEHAAVAAVAA